MKWRLKSATKSACKTLHFLFHAVEIHEKELTRDLIFAKALDNRHEWKHTYGSHVEYKDSRSIEFSENDRLIPTIKKVLSMEFLPLLEKFDEDEKKEVMDSVENEVDKYFSKVTCEEL